jgi:DNA-directed RNA polymerase subunit RPC12/RpoP
MKLFRYEAGVIISLAVRFACEACGKPNLIDTAELLAGNYYRCPFCDHSMRMTAAQADEVSSQLLLMGLEIGAILPAPEGEA